MVHQLSDFGSHALNIETSRVSCSGAVVIKEGKSDHFPVFAELYLKNKG
jgi:fructose-1,6-bisphosphatase/sedoheptulose 1,7-bisphosphatase-like protein